MCVAVGEPVELLASNFILRAVIGCPTCVLSAYLTVWPAFQTLQIRWIYCANHTYSKPCHLLYGHAFSRKTLKSWVGSAVNYLKTSSKKGQDLQAWTLWRGKRWRSIHDFALVWTFLILSIQSIHVAAKNRSHGHVESARIVNPLWKYAALVARGRTDASLTMQTSQETLQTVGNRWLAAVYISCSIDSVLSLQKSWEGNWWGNRGSSLQYSTFFASKLGGSGQSRHGLSKSVTLATDYVRCFRFLIPGHCQSAERRSSHVAVSRRNCTQQSPSWRARNFGTPAAEKHWKQVNMEKLKSLLRLRSTTLRFLQNLYIYINNNPGWAALCTLCKVVLESQGRTLKFSIQEQSGELQIQGY